MTTPRTRLPKRRTQSERSDEMRERLKAGDTLVLFPEGTSSDGFSVKSFKSSFFGAAEVEGVIVQPVTLAYRGHRNLPMTRRLMPFYAWYGDMDLAERLHRGQADFGAGGVKQPHGGFALCGDQCGRGNAQRAGGGRGRWAWGS